jgi:hypothetical protein
MSIDHTDSVNSGPPLDSRFHIHEPGGHCMARSDAEMNSRYKTAVTVPSSPDAIDSLTFT